MKFEIKKTIWDIVSKIKQDKKVCTKNKQNIEINKNMYYIKNTNFEKKK